MSTPLHQQLLEIHAWTARQIEVRNEYREHPFASRTALCPGDCGGYIALTNNNTIDYCTPCNNNQQARTRP
jgi:hypothetical protein